MNSALSTYFFGENRNKKLTIEKFLDFQEQLQREILSLEVRRSACISTYEPMFNLISSIDTTVVRFFSPAL